MFGLATKKELEKLEKRIALLEAASSPKVKVIKETQFEGKKKARLMNGGDYMFTLYLHDPNQKPMTIRHIETCSSFTKAREWAESMMVKYSEIMSKYLTKHVFLGIANGNGRVKNNTKHRYSFRKKTWERSK